MRGKRLTIYIGETDRYRHGSLYMAILQQLRALGCAGATVTRGIAGFGVHSQIKTIRLLELSADLPIVITVIDSAERIERVLPEVASMLAGGTMTLEDTEIVFTSAAFSGGLPAMAVCQIMRTDVARVHEGTPAVDAVRQLVAATFSGLPVVDDQNVVVGFVNDGDLLGARLMALDASEQRALDPRLGAELLRELERQGTRVSDVMRRPAITVAPASSLREAAHRMHADGIKHLPVVDESGKLVGIIGRLDVLQAIASGHATRGGENAPSLPQERARVEDVMEAEVPSIAEQAPLSEALERLLGAAARQLVVVDDARHPKGVITATDLISRVDAEARPGILMRLKGRFSEDAAREVRRSTGERAGDLMTSPVVAIRSNAAVIEALTVMVTQHVKHLPVVDDAGRLVGIVSRTAVLAASLAPAARPGEDPA